MAIPVFIAYARVDKPFREELVKHLGLLEKQGLIRVWHDGLIQPSAPWEVEIEKHLLEARLIVFLVSADFFHSDYCHDKEMKRALVRHERGEARGLPVLVRDCLWQDSPLAHLQLLPADAKPVDKWSNQDAAWVDVARGIKAEVLKLRDAEARVERQAGQSRVVPVANPLPNDGFPWRKARWPALVAALLVGGLVLLKAWPESSPMQGSDDAAQASASGPPSVEAQNASGPNDPAPQPRLPKTEGAPPHALAGIDPMAFKNLPAGSFMMGSPAGEAGRDTDEKQHPADVLAFEIGVHEVTQKQWKSVMGAKEFDCRWGCGDSIPAHSVTWFETVAFMNKLTELENKKLPEGGKRTVCYSQKNGEWIWDRECTGYRLPTETEWEYAARAGTTTAYSFGNDANDICRYGNGGDAVAKRKHPDWTWLTPTCEDDKYPELAPVGSFKPNPWGLHDMHGNAWEWIWDLYAEYPSSSKPGYAGPDKTPEARRVLRGGSFDYDGGPWGLRSSVRDWVRPSDRSVSIGFRCVRGSLPPASSP